MAGFQVAINGRFWVATEATEWSGSSTPCYTAQDVGDGKLGRACPTELASERAFVLPALSLG